MWATFPVISLALTTILLRGNKISTCHSLRLAFVLSITLHATFLYISTEILSLFNAINMVWIRISWVAIVVLQSIYLIKTKGFKKNLRFDDLKKYFAENILALFVTFFVFFISLITCLFAFPNNWDSMTYHITRVMHWIQNANVNHYPSHIDRQLGMSPLAEYILLHIKLLSNYDPLLNLVQWFSMAGSVIVVSLLTKEVGGNTRTQILSSCIVATIPMGILQSNSTQNDYVVGFFVIASILFLFKCLQNKFRAADVFFFMLSCCLAAVTKGTAFIFLFVPIIIWVIAATRVLKFKIVKPLLIGVTIGALFLLPPALRNQQTFSNSLGADYHFSNEAYGIAPTLSNMSKNIAMHFKTPVPAINAAVENMVIRFHELIDINVNSDRYNWSYSPSFDGRYFSAHEDSAGNLLHVILFFVCFIVFISNKHLRSNKMITLLLILCIAMFILFCTLLKWQVWHCRLHLPMFIVSAPFVAIVLNSLRFKFLINTIIILLLASSVIFLFANQSRPWFGDKNIFTTSLAEQYFINNNKLEKPFVEMTQFVQNKGLPHVGLVTSGDGWQYPFYVLLKNDPELVIQQVMVQNSSNQYETNSAYQNFIPDVVIYNNYEKDDDSFKYKNYRYELVYRFENWVMFEKTMEN